MRRSITQSTRCLYTNVIPDVPSRESSPSAGPSIPFPKCVFAISTCPSAVRRKHIKGEADIFTRPAFNRSRARACLGALLALCGTSPVRAQSLSSFHRVPGTDGLNIWVGGSVGTYMANANENIHGSLRMIGLQWTHDLFAFKRARFSWVIEALPLLLVNSAAPTSRVPLTLLSNASLGNANPGMNSHVFYTRFTRRRRE